jgi:hypothetical protein
MKDIVVENNILEDYLINTEELFGLEKAIDVVTEVYKTNEETKLYDLKKLIKNIPEKYLSKRLLMEKILLK